MKLPEKTDGGEYQPAGFCSFCLMSMEAKQPGGRDPRHKSNQVPYGECPQALKAKKGKK